MMEHSLLWTLLDVRKTLLKTGTTLLARTKMRKVTKSPKNLFGPLFVTALLSIVVAKFLSDFAAASESPAPIVEAASLAGDGRFIGDYTVTEINETKGRVVGDICKHQAEHIPPDDDQSCFQKVWAYSKENQLILVKAPTQSEVSADHFSLYSLEGECKTKGSIKEAQQNGIFSMALCEASGNAGSKALGGTIGLTQNPQSLEMPADSTSLVLPGETVQGEIKFSENKILIHKFLKSRWGFIFPTTAYDDVIVLEPVKPTH
jgi:hypothetical protein